MKTPRSLYLCGLITPKNPLVSLGPVVKKRSVVLPLSAEPPPNSIPQSPLIVIGYSYQTSRRAISRAKWARGSSEKSG